MLPSLNKCLSYAYAAILIIHILYTHINHYYAAVKTHSKFVLSIHTINAKYESYTKKIKSAMVISHMILSLLIIIIFFFLHLVQFKTIFFFFFILRRP